jgi:hypothetical protein
VELVDRPGVYFLAPTPDAQTGIRGLLLQHHLHNPVEQFFPVFPVDTSCRDGDAACEVAEVRTGIVLADDSGKAGWVTGQRLVYNLECRSLLSAGCSKVKTDLQHSNHS